MFRTAGIIKEPEIEPQGTSNLLALKLKLEIFQSRTTDDLDEQVINSQVFFDYDKKIHTLSDSEFLTKLLSKNNTLQNTLKDLFDENSGFYLM